MPTLAKRIRFLLAACLFVLGSPATARSADLDCAQEIAIPGSPAAGTTVRKGLAIDREGRVWFTQLEGNQIGVLDPTRLSIEVFDIPTLATGPHSIAVDSTGIAWFSEIDGHAIGRFDLRTESFEQVPIPTPMSMPYGITVDVAGNVWWTEMNAIAIGERVAATGEVREFPLDQNLDAASNIAIDPTDQQVWITELERGAIGRLDPVSGSFQRYHVPLPLAAPHSLVVSQSGDVWFTDVTWNKIGRLTPSSGRFQMYDIPTPRATSHGIAIDGERVWFTELDGNKIGLLNPDTGAIKELAVATVNAKPYFIALDQQGRVWFNEGNAPNLGLVSCRALATPEAGFGLANRPPAFGAATPCGSVVLTGALGPPLPIAVQASDPDLDDPVALNALALPLWAHLEAASGSPATGTLLVAPGLLDWLFGLVGGPAAAVLSATDSEIPPETTTCGIELRVGLLGG
jgi:virginiamycin B lyase